MDNDIEWHDNVMSEEYKTNLNGAMIIVPIASYIGLIVLFMLIMGLILKIINEIRDIIFAISIIIFIPLLSYITILMSKRTIPTKVGFSESALHTINTNEKEKTIYWHKIIKFEEIYEGSDGKVLYYNQYGKAVTEVLAMDMYNIALSKWEEYTGKKNIEIMP